MVSSHSYKDQIWVAQFELFFLLLKPIQMITQDSHEGFI